MLAVACVLRRPWWLRQLWLLWVCLLVGATVASAASPVIADFDGDRQPDRAELNRHEPSAVRVWLSATGRTSVVRSSTPILGIAARDLDGDRRAELIASRTSTGLQVWTTRRHGFAAFHPKRGTRSTLSPPTRHTVNDGPAEALEATDQTVPEAPVPAPPPQAFRVVLPTARISTPIFVRPESWHVLAPHGPRPPPFSD